mmetsp:Transcript_15362/g.22431  ORF Transcript_15362/g.22431 Transcript_15362/m.22431 type:complete len:143 (-) Transcript_15362:88-516(-)
MKYAKGHQASTPKEADVDRDKLLLAKSLHGIFFKEQREIPQVDLDQSWRWLRTSGLRYEAEAAICAAQEQALATNNIKKKIWKKDVLPLCCLCKRHDETVAHLISGYSSIAKKKYTPRHDSVAKYIHWTILQDYCDPVSKQW